MKRLIEKSFELLRNQHFDHLAVGVLDFSKSTFSSFEILEKNILSPKPLAYFDLASLTKPLTLACTKIYHPELFDTKLNLLLNHRAGLPIGGRLSKINWKEELFSYEIKESETLYSDYSALRLQLELEKRSGKTLKDLCSLFWDEGLSFWKELPPSVFTPATGFRGGKILSGEVHDPNAFTLSTFTSHAGLFATIDGLCRSLLRLNKEKKIVQLMNESFQEKKHRFLEGWDTVENPSVSLAGPKASLKTFGHLGFTGTSIWIDCEKQLGAVILSNATQNYWYDKADLNHLRRTLGEMIFSLAE